MKYKVEVDINLPRERVLELFDNQENLKNWLDGMQSFEHLSGEAGKEGAKSLYKFKMGKREVEIIETVTKRNLPEEFSGHFESDAMWNGVQNFFYENNDNSTRWVAENEFKGTNFMMKMMLFLMPGAFKKRSLRHMKAFKSWAESL